MPRAVLSGGGGVLSLFLASTWFAGNQEMAPEHASLDVVPATEGDELFTPDWALESLGMAELEALEVAGEPKPPPQCNFYLGNVTHESDTCSPFTIARLSSAAASKAVARATACAVDAETDCVLSVDVGFALPTAFLLVDDHTELEAVVAPRIVDASEEVTAVRVEHPLGAHHGGAAAGGGTLLEFHKEVTVEWLEPFQRNVVQRRLANASAFCVQLLRRAYSPSCWAKLD